MRFSPHQGHGYVIIEISQPAAEFVFQKDTITRHEHLQIFVYPRWRGLSHHIYELKWCALTGYGTNSSQVHIRRTPLIYHSHQTRRCRRQQPCQYLSYEMIPTFHRWRRPLATGFWSQAYRPQPRLGQTVAPMHSSSSLRQYWRKEHSNPNTD